MRYENTNLWNIFASSISIQPNMPHERELNKLYTKSIKRHTYNIQQK